MEFAYPGVGILAGDSIQYLSIATAHGVIMVFFMVMPAIFGAFGNFLLPTQLGVHDVAFPRLNSAAFWFLPGGLIMLCQLVCVDRRYQRMNCFNIRELQGILKRKFFTDLVNTSDSHKAVESTLINMRHKNNMSNILLYDQSLFYNFDLTNTSKFKNFSFTPGKVYSYSGINFYPQIINTVTITNSIFSISLINYFKIFSSVLKDLVGFVYVPGTTTLLNYLSSFSFFKKTISNSLYFDSANFLKFFQLNNHVIQTHSTTTTSLYNSSIINYSTLLNLSSSSLAENSSS
jgi:hypothetical protein